MKIAKGRFLRNLWLKLIAIILAVITWLIVVNVDDYIVTKTIRGIPVEQVNGEKLESMGQIYTVTSGETVDVSVKGPRSLVERMTAEDFYASADLSQLSVTNTAEISVSLVENHANVTVTRLNTTMTLSLEEKVERELPVNVVTMGNVMEGYALGSCTAKPNIVTIEGAASVLENVKELRAVVDVDKAYSTFTSEVSLSCFDIYGESMEGKKITLSENSVLVTVPVYPTKEVEVRVEIAGNPADGYSVSGVNFNPQTVRIAGDAATIADITEVVIDDISISGITETKEENIRLDDYLPKGVETVEDGAQVAVSVSVEKQETKTISLNSSQIGIVSKEKDYNYSITFSGTLNVEISGLSSDLEEVTAESLHPQVDAAGLSPGQYALQLDFTYDKEKVSIDKTFSVILTVEEKPTEE